jgi:hypothetical protein
MKFFNAKQLIEKADIQTKLKNMRKFISSLFLSFIMLSNAFAQDYPSKEIKSDVTDVTVFLEGAQETRKIDVDLLPGKTMLKFIGLSPFTDAKSVQVKADGDLTIMTVNHQQNFLSKTEKSEELKDLETRIADVRDKINLENTYLEIIKQDIEFLTANRELAGKDQALTVAALKEGSEFFSTKLTALKLKEIERRKTLVSLNRQLIDLNSQKLNMTSKKEYATGEVYVLVDVKKAGKFKFELINLVSNAGWYPSYDIRANNITDPVQIVYKANIRQDTKTDWKNVKLKLSSYNPSVSGVAPELNTYFLDYGMMPPVYGKSITSISGRITDNKNEPLPGAVIKVEGSGIATVANAQGYYSLTLPANSEEIAVSFLGYLPRTARINGSVINVSLQEDVAKLQEVSVIAYGAKAKNEELGVEIADLAEHKVIVEERPSIKGLDMRIRGVSSLPQVAKAQKQVSVDFAIKNPYTVKSDNKIVSVDMSLMDVPADYIYYCVPKRNKDAFLMARIKDWEKYDFLEGEANVFFEDTFVGKTILDISNASDTLSVSLGIDKNISVNREKVKDYSSKQFIGSKQEVTRDWKTTIRNNRSEKVNMTIVDQVPVSTNQEIEVNVQTTGGAEKNPLNGEVKWKISIEPGKTQELGLKYSVKYPKNRDLVIE